MKRALILFFLIVLSGCIDPIKLEIDEGAGTLVVDGLITDQPGPYTIKVSRSINFDNSRQLRVYAVPESGAILRITDNTGFSETLVERKPGEYETLALQGSVGKSYQLTIQTSNGESYVSGSETMYPAPPVERIEQEFKVYDRLFISANGSPRVTKMEGFYIYAVVNDPADAENFYRWQSDGIFEYFSITDFSHIKQCWAPLNRLEDKLILADDVFTNGQTMRQFVCVVPYDRPTMFLVKLRQQSLSREAYEFWQRSASQQTSTGSLFDPPPAPVYGNVRSEADPNVKALGYFGVSAIAKFDLLMNRFKESGLVEPAPHKTPKGGDCRVHEIEGTNIKPEGF